MKTIGFTFIRNAIKYDYPIVEAVLSILPICEQVIIAVGNSDDGTRELLEQLDEPKIKLIDTVWDDTLRKGGEVLAVETNKALAEIPKDADWAFYIQGDEVFQTEDLEDLRQSMEKYKDDEQVDGLLFDYLHFYGSYNYIGNSSRWYKNEIRIIKLNRDIYSYRDAQGFRKGNNMKLNVRKSGGMIHHYGWVRPPYAQQRKQEDFNKLWHSDERVEKMVAKQEEYDYLSAIDSLELFQGNHPELMKERIAKQDWIFNYDTTQNYLKPKDKFKKFLQKITGKHIGEYQNYKLLKDE